MPNAWDDLPNAKHIDRVLAHVAAHFKRWEWAVYNMSVNVRVAALDHFHDELSKTNRLGECALARAAASAAVPSAFPKIAECARAVVTALSADDDCAYILDLPPDAVRTLAGSGNHAAVLLYPAVQAMYEGDK